MLVAILVAALLVARTCGETAAEVTTDEAVEIATAEVDFEPTSHQIRLIKRGLQSQEIWLVGLERRDENGVITDATSVLVDADTGEVIEIREGV
jgi:hypothetical protein